MTNRYDIPATERLHWIITLVGANKTIEFSQETYGDEHVKFEQWDRQVLITHADGTMSSTIVSGRVWRALEQAARTV